MFELSRLLIKPYWFEIKGNKRIFGIRLVILCGSLVMITFAVGFLLGYLSTPAQTVPSIGNIYYDSLVRDDANNQVARDKLLNEIKPENVKKHLKYRILIYGFSMISLIIHRIARFFTSFAHRAGTRGGKAVSDYIHDQWKEQGVDIVKLFPYDVLLDVPDPDNLNKLVI